ncbi:TolC family protein [Achromobacter insuavis]
MRRAFQDVEDALAGLNAEQARQLSLAAAVHDSQDALDRATRLYRNGLSGYLGVLTAQRATYQARDALALSQLARVRHAIGLYKALGAGWQPPSTTAQPAAQPLASPPFPPPRLSGSLMSIHPDAFRIHDVRRYPLCLFDPAQVHPATPPNGRPKWKPCWRPASPSPWPTSNWTPSNHTKTASSAALAQTQQGASGAALQGPDQRRFDAGRRAEAERQGQLAARAFGIPHEAVATLEEAVALTRHLTRPLPARPADAYDMRGWENIS